MQLVGYHGTLKENANNIIRTKKYEYDETRKHWLGDGIYFFEDAFFAFRWANDMSKKNKKDPAVLKNILNLDSSRYLDLTDAKNKDDFRNDFIKFLNDLKNEKFSFGDSNTSEKEILCLYYNFIKVDKGYDVIKNNFIKKNPSFAKKKICNMSINLNNDLFTGLNYVEVQICATNNSVIKDIELFSKEEY